MPRARVAAAQLLAAPIQLAGGRAGSEAVSRERRGAGECPPGARTYMMAA
jgi:hypothetical protein